MCSVAGIILPSYDCAIQPLWHFHPQWTVKSELSHWVWNIASQFTRLKQWKLNSLSQSNCTKICKNETALLYFCVFWVWTYRIKYSFTLIIQFCTALSESKHCFLLFGNSVTSVCIHLKMGPMETRFIVKWQQKTWHLVFVLPIPPLYPPLNCTVVSFHSAIRVKPTW